MLEPFLPLIYSPYPLLSMILSFLIFGILTVSLFTYENKNKR